MKKTLFFALSILVVTISLCGVVYAAEETIPADEEATERAVPAEGAPAIVFEKVEHDFGNMEPQKSVKHIFKFKNAGNALLLIEKVRATCGCTGTLLSQKETPPGGEGTIEVTFRSGLSGGNQRKSIYVHSNDPKQPAAQLTIKAYVVVPVEIKPRSVYWVVEKNKPSTREARLIHQPDVKMNIVEIESSSPAFSASVEPATDAATPTYHIKITCDGSLPTGNFREKLVIHTDNPDHPTLNLNIRGSVAGSVRITPNAVSLGVIKDNVIPARIVRVYATEKADFEIESVEPTSPIVSADVKKEEKSNRYMINVTLTERPPLGAFSEKLIIKTNVPEEQTLEIPIHAFVR
jgi:hypothetical protein